MARSGRGGKIRTCNFLFLRQAPLPVGLHPHSRIGTGGGRRARNLLDLHEPPLPVGRLRHGWWQRRESNPRGGSRTRRIYNPPPAPTELRCREREMAEGGGHDPHARRHAPGSSRAAGHPAFTLRVAVGGGVEPLAQRPTRFSRPVPVHHEGHPPSESSGYWMSADRARDPVVAIGCLGVGSGCARGPCRM